jgi:2-keto-4-pentenoate hydratase/2-oxohepta-3-ene-1,7-dioic acid hydratase in catechol pathway
MVSYGNPGEERLGLLLKGEKQIIDLNHADGNIPPNMLQFLRGDFWERARRILADTNKVDPGAFIDQGKVRLGAPVPRPNQIICVGLNYKDHADEQGVEYPREPLLFAKARSAANGPEDAIIFPEEVEKLDYEVELAVIVGKVTKEISAERILAHVAGYCVFNDISARCKQYGDKQWFRGKSYDTFAPFGPALVTPDEVGNPCCLDLTCRVNDRVRQRSNTSRMIHSPAAVLAHVAKGITLQPGDVIATGTPAGVGIFRKPPQLLKRGDVVEAEVERLGKLVNRVE